MYKLQIYKVVIQEIMHLVVNILFIVVVVVVMMMGGGGAWPPWLPLGSATMYTLQNNKKGQPLHKGQKAGSQVCQLFGGSSIDHNQGINMAYPPPPPPPPPPPRTG